jgi:SAM-dependent methyltransferase
LEFELITDRRIVDESMEKILFTKQLVLDLGASNRFNKQFGQYKNKKIQADYLCTDLQMGDVDFVSNIEAVPIADNSIDAVICNAVLEHVAEPWTAAKEIYRILKPGGVAFLYVPFLYPYHGQSNPVSVEHVGFEDCYRYTIDGIRYLFRDFSKMRLSPVEYGLLAWWRMIVRYRLTGSYPWVLRLQRLIEWRAGRPIGVSQATGFDFWVEK